MRAVGENSVVAEQDTEGHQLMKIGKGNGGEDGDDGESRKQTESKQEVEPESLLVPIPMT